MKSEKEKERVSKATYVSVNVFLQLRLTRSRSSRGSAASTGGIRVERGLVKGLSRLRDIQRRILGEEPIGFQHNTDTLHRHDGEVFDAGVVS